jgi:CHAD domain-containing protein
VRLGDDPEDVHQARVGTRRLRSDLRTFRSLVDSGWAGPLRDELSWLADLLGGVRDADVLAERLRRQVDELPEVDAAGFAPVLLRLSQEREAARAVLLVALRSDRYLTLLERLVAAASEPQLVEKAASEPARDVLPGLVARPWRSLRKAVKALPSKPPDEALHQVRIRAKRARYAAEAANPVFGNKSARFAKAVAGVQGVLGDQHDAVVAEGWLRDHVPGTELGQALVVGELVAVQRAEAAACRKAWRKAWKEADGKKLRRWLE